MVGVTNKCSFQLVTAHQREVTPPSSSTATVPPRRSAAISTRVPPRCAVAFPHVHASKRKTVNIDRVSSSASANEKGWAFRHASQNPFGTSVSIVVADEIVSDGETRRPVHAL